MCRDINSEVQVIKSLSASQPTYKILQNVHDEIMFSEPVWNEEICCVMTATTMTVI